MFLVALICALFCTIGSCLVGLLIKWVIAQAGAAIFVVVLVGFCCVFFLVGDAENG